MNFVLDAATALSWAFEDRRDARAIAVLHRLAEGEAIVPATWGVEVSNELLAAERRGRIESGDVARFTALLQGLPIVVDPADRSRPLSVIPRLARQHGLSAFGACYLDLALSLGIPLACANDDLRAAAAAEGVEVL